MTKVVMVLGLVLGLAVGVPSAGAQDYRGRIQGLVNDSSAAALPGTTITLRNDATGVAVTNVTDEAAATSSTPHRAGNVHDHR